MPSKAQDVLAVEELVHEIKENLRLKAPPPSSVAAAAMQHSRSLRRPSPYHIPCRSWSDTCSTTPGSGSESANSVNGSQASSCSQFARPLHSHHHHHLLLHHTSQHRKGSSTGSSNSTKSGEDIDDPYELLQVLIKNNNLVKEAVRRLQLNLSPKQRYFYESDEESSRSPLLRMCQLEL